MTTKKNEPKDDLKGRRRMWLYERRLLDLEKDFELARNTITALIKKLKAKPETVDTASIKSQLDLVSGLVKLLKELVSFYLKLGRLYDLVSLHEDFVEELRKRDPVLCSSIMSELDDRWKLP